MWKNVSLKLFPIKSLTLNKCFLMITFSVCVHLCRDLQAASSVIPPA